MEKTKFCTITDAEKLIEQLTKENERLRALIETVKIIMKHDNRLDTIEEIINQ